VLLLHYNTVHMCCCFTIKQYTCAVASLYKASTSSFVYTATGVVDAVDITFGPDNLLWIAEQANDDVLVHITELFLQLSPPLFHLCRLSILPYLL